MGILRLLSGVSLQDIYKVFKDGIIAFLNAVLHWPFSQEREKEMGKEEEENQEKKKKKKKRRRRSGKVEVSMEEECETDAHNSQGPISAEHRELVKYVQENLKEMKTKFTDEEVYEMLKLCNMDPELAIQRLYSLEGFEEVKSKWTKKKERINAQWSKSQHAVGSSSVQKQGESVDDNDAGRTDTTSDSTVQGLQEADSSARSQLDNVSLPPAAPVSSIASQLPGPNIGNRKGKEVVRSMDDNTAVISRSHDPPLHAVDPPKLHAPGAGSDPRVSKNNVASLSRNDLGKLPTASESLSTMRNGEFSGERSIGGLQTDGTEVMPSESKELLIPRTHASEAGADGSNPNSGSSGTSESELLPTSSEPTIHAEESKTQHEVSSGSNVKQGGNCDDDDAGRTDKTHDDTVQGLQEADSKGISQLDDVSSPPAAAVSSVASQLHGPNMGNRKGKEVVRSADDNNAVISRSHDPPLHAVDPLRLRASSAGSDPWASRNNAATVFAHQASAGSSSTHNWNGNEFGGEKWIWGESEVFLTPDREKLELLQAVYYALNNPYPGSSGTWERELSPTSSESSGSSEATPSMDCNLPFRDPQDPVLDAPFACSRYGPIQRPGKMPEHGDMPSAQQHLHQGGSLSWANGTASGQGSFQGAGRTCYQSPPIPPYSPAPFNIPQTRSGPALHAQHQYGNDNHPLTIPGLTATPDGIFPTQALWPANANNRCNGRGSFPQYDNRGAQSQQHPRTGVRPNQYGSFNNPRTSSGSTLHDQYQYRNDYYHLTIPGPVVTAHGSFPLRPLLTANANNWCGGEGSSPQYDNQGGLRWQCPGTRVRPSHRLQSPYNRTTGNLQDPSSMQPPRDLGP